MAYWFLSSDWYGFLLRENIATHAIPNAREREQYESFATMKEISWTHRVMFVDTQDLKAYIQCIAFNQPGPAASPSHWSPESVASSYLRTKWMVPTRGPLVQMGLSWRLRQLTASIGSWQPTFVRTEVRQRLSVGEFSANEMAYSTSPRHENYYMIIRNINIK